MPALLRLAGAILVAASLLTASLIGLETLAGEPPETRGEILIELVESLLLVTAMFSSAVFVTRLRKVEREAARLRLDITDAVLAGVEWRQRSERLLADLSQAVEEQFQAWGLTAAESDVAGLILKGLSLKQIAEARSTSEATIRQQAQSAYRKSGLSNRAEFAAFFLDDLFATGAASAAGPAAAAR